MMNKTILSIIAIFQLFAFAFAEIPITSKRAYGTLGFYNITYPANSIEDEATLDIRGRLSVPSENCNLTKVTVLGDGVEDIGEPEASGTSFIGHWKIPKSALGEDITVLVHAITTDGEDYSYATPLWAIGGYTLKNGTQSTFSTEL